MIFRALTYTIDIDNFSSEDFKLSFQKLKNIISNEYKIRTFRINTLPLNKIDSKGLLFKIDNVLDTLNNHEVRWLNISFNLNDKSRFEIDEISKTSLRILKNYKSVFINWIFNSNNKEALDASSNLVLNNSRLSSTGYDNFRFGINCNILPGTPFFPFSYGLKVNQFSIAVESIKPFLQFFSNPEDLETPFLEIKKKLLDFQKLFKEDQSFLGYDLSFAPFPDENISIKDIYSILGLSEFGSLGTTYITSKLTSFLKKFVNDEQIKTCGFNGVMFSLLEDKLLAKENNFKTFTMNDFLLYSSVCGCGIDMIPISGNILPEQVKSLIFDTFSISEKYQKPLGVRVLPIPNKKDNEFTEFDMEFIENTRVIGIPRGYL